MPKTNIYPPNTDDHTADRRVEVGWHPNGIVQIATTQLTNPANLSITDAQATPEWVGTCFVDLNRHGINQLIRALREARDKAYGRDE